MNFARADAIARAVLYEGYNLYPYRPSALKNRHRWTFGGVFPKAWAAQERHDRCFLETQCLLEGGLDSEIAVRLRFLHIFAREIGALHQPVEALPADGEPPLTRTAWLELGDRLLIEWEEAREREVALPSRRLAELLMAPAQIRFAYEAEREVEPVRGADGRIAALIIRAAKPLSGSLTVSATKLAAGLYRLVARIDNDTPLDAAALADRQTAQASAFASAHTLLAVDGGDFVSLLDPPPALAAAAALCHNDGTWPVLAGRPGERDLLLSSPIILYDHPQIAPESPGDLFDGCEIDEILTLRILTLTDAEKREMMAADPTTRALLTRTEALSEDQLARLHGAFRNIPQDAPASALRIGDRVRIKPKDGGDVMDVVLEGQVAVVEAIERDFEDRLHVAVTIEGDPGRDLGLARMPGHRFFFAEDELLPLASGEAP